MIQLVKLLNKPYMKRERGNKKDPLSIKDEQHHRDLIIHLLPRLWDIHFQRPNDIFEVSRIYLLCIINSQTHFSIQYKKVR